MRSDDAFNILSIDGGGGIRGVYAAHVLARLEDALASPVGERFDLIAGTSTGSIIAGAASMGIPMETLVGLFESHADRIFKKRRFSLFPLMRSRYSTHPLDGVIGEYLPEVTMGEVPTPLMITSSDVSTGGVHVFKSRYLEELGEPYMRDGKVRLRDAILASCAAPLYFDPRRVGEYLLADGGLWANNPTIIAVIEAMSKFRRPLGDIRVLSVGTGRTASFYTRSRGLGSPHRMERTEAGHVRAGPAVPGVDQHGQVAAGRPARAPRPGDQVVEAGRHQEHGESEGPGRQGLHP